MKIVTTFHQPSSVLSSIKCQLSSRDLEHLVVAKVNRIEVYSLQPHGLRSECSLEIWGKVLTVKAIPIDAGGSARSSLLLMISHPDPELVFLTYTETDEKYGELTARKQLSLYERSPRPAEFFNDVLIHPTGKLAVVSCYTGKLKIIKLKAGNYQEDFDVSLPEINLFGLAFLPLPETDYALAILYLDYQERVQLLARDILVDDLELSPYPSTVLHPTPISGKILPCPTECIPQLAPVPEGMMEDEADSGEHFMGGLLIIGGKKILLFEMANNDSQAKQRGKRRRLEAKKKSVDAADMEKAKEKEKEREGRKRKPRCSVDWPWSSITAYCAVDQHSSRYLIGDSFGRLAMLSADNLKEQGLVLVPLGETSPPTTLTYLMNQMLYVGSHLGDSQLLQISSAPTFSLTSPTLPIPPEVKTISAASLGAPSTDKGKGRATSDEDESDRNPSKGCIINSMGSYVSPVDTFKNIAPIVDAVLVDTDGSGQRQLVTCSGGGNTGSVNIVRNGADFQELASIPGVTGITNVWAVRNLFEDTTDTHILVSTLQSSHLFEINDTGSSTTLSYVQEHPSKGFATNLPTLAFSNVARRVIGANGKSSYGNSQLVVQVTPKGAFLLEFDMSLGAYVQHASWELPGTEVVAGAVNPSQVLLALSGGRLIALTILEGNTFKEVIRGEPGIPHEISTVSCTPLDPSKYTSNFVTVSYWGINTVEIFSLESGGFVSVSKSPPLPALVRSAFLYNFGSDHSSKGEDYHPHLLVGLSDGSVVHFPWKDKALKDKKIISLGHAPVSLTMCQVDGKRTVFAAGNRSTVLSWEKKRLHHSPIMLKEILGVAQLNTAAFPSSLILGTSHGLFIGRVRDLNKMHIRSIPFGLETPRRLAYQPDLKVFGIACTHTEPGRIGDFEVSKSSFYLLDDTTFSNMSHFNCEVGEEITAVLAISPVVNGKSMPLFCLGTYTYEPEEKETMDGRLLIFTAFHSESQTNGTDLQLSLVTSSDVRGCVYAMTLVNDMIVVSVNSSVMLYRLKSSDDAPTLTLELCSEWNHNYLVTGLASYGDYVVAGDQISSVSLLKISNFKVENVARDYGPLWPICVEASNEESVIGANDALNLFTFTMSQSGGRRVLEHDGGYHVADFVTKFIRGRLTSSDTNAAALVPKHIFFTSSGRVGVIIDVTDDQLSLHLTALQRNMAATTQGVGGVSHTRFRAPKSTRGRSDADVASFGFIDGDFLEQFLAHLGTPEQVDKINSGESDAERLTMPMEEIQRVLENLQSMH